MNEAAGSFSTSNFSALPPTEERLGLDENARRDCDHLGIFCFDVFGDGNRIAAVFLQFDLVDLESVTAVLTNKDITFLNIPAAARFETDLASVERCADTSVRRLDRHDFHLDSIYCDRKERGLSRDSRLGYDQRSVLDIRPGKFDGGKTHGQSREDKKNDERLAAYGVK